jgi:ABC-type antimicrobial peptide transport system permease subunit
VQGEDIYFVEPGREAVTVEKNVQRVAESVVQIQTASGLGSGFIINKLGYVITNQHVIAGEREITVLVYKKKQGGLEKQSFTKVKIIAMNGYLDLAILQIEDEEAAKGLPFVPINAVAFDAADPVAVAAAIESGVPGVSAYSRDEAVSLIPGIESISQSFGILVGLTFVIGIVVIGFFFLILTVQKLKPFTLLRAIGTSTGRLAATVAIQITLVVFLASAIAVGLTLLAVQGLNTGLPVTIEPGLIIGVVLSVWIFSLLAGLLSIRRIARIDPASAVGAR